MTTGFADLVRELPDDRLAALLRLRPYLVVPVPADLSALAARAQARVSVARALDPLDRFTLEILDALRLSRVDDRADLDAVLALTAAGHPAAEPPIGTTAAPDSNPTRAQRRLGDAPLSNPTRDQRRLGDAPLSNPTRDQ